MPQPLVQNEDLDQMMKWGRSYAHNPDYCQHELYRAAEYVAAASSEDEEWRLLNWFEEGARNVVKSQGRLNDVMWAVKDKAKFIKIDN